MTACHQSAATIKRRLHTLRTYVRFVRLQEGRSDITSRATKMLTLSISKAMPHRGGGEGLAVSDDLRDEPRGLDAAQVERLRAAVQRTARPGLRRRDLAILEVMLQAGLRLAEVARLQLRDLVVTRDGMRLNVSSAGGESGAAAGRQVPLKAGLVRALRDYIAARPALGDRSFLFVSQQGKALSVRAIQRLVETYSRAAQLVGVCANTLRHTCAYTLLAEGHPGQQVAGWLGHRHIESLRRYRKPAAAG